MKEKVSVLMTKFLNRETISYLIFGVLTTIINIEVFWLADRAFIAGGMDAKASALISNIIAWVISVAFAFVTNKLFVFESRDMSAGVLFKELLNFTIARLLSLAFDEAFMFVAIMFMPSIVAKIISNVFVVIINYVLSKFFIFKNK